MIEVHGESDRGQRRSHNEDSFKVDADKGLLMVADGMGGHAAGEVASAIAIRSITEFIEQTGENPDLTWPFGFDPELSFESNVLRSAITLAHRHVKQAAEERDEYVGMGTTVVCALIKDRVVHVANVGDSRAYLLRGGELVQVTEDHTWIAEQVRGGILTPQEVRSHPWRNVVTRALGSRPQADIDVASFELHPKDLLLLCSDGLSSMIDDSEIHKLMQKYADDLDSAASALIEAANQAGGEDNITVVLARYTDNKGSLEDTQPTTPPPA
ncbi:MAG TPA: Stp1/IreP family PP2C-type Ser/Thr phosphatase [Acidobacteriota bacterium]